MGQVTHVNCDKRRQKRQAKGADSRVARGPLRTGRATFTTSGSSNHPKDTLSQVTHSSIGFLPVNGLPIRLRLGSGC